MWAFNAGLWLGYNFCGKKLADIYTIAQHERRVVSVVPKDQVGQWAQSWIISGGWHTWWRLGGFMPAPNCPESTWFLSLLHSLDFSCTYRQPVGAATILSLRPGNPNYWSLFCMPHWSVCRSQSIQYRQMAFGKRTFVVEYKCKFIYIGPTRLDSLEPVFLHIVTEDECDTRFRFIFLPTYHSGQKNSIEGHFTRETESPWPLHSKHLSLLEKAEPVQVCFTLRLRDQRSMGMQDGCEVYMDSYMASNGPCFMITWIILKIHLVEVGLIQNRKTMALWKLITIDLFYFIICENPHEYKLIEKAFGWGPGPIWLHTTLMIHDHTTWFWRCGGKAFGHFLLGSHNFMVTALGSYVKWPLDWGHVN
jgi:hypothetical protein